MLLFVLMTLFAFQPDSKRKVLSIANTVKRFPSDNAYQIKLTEPVQQIAPPLQDKKKISEKSESNLTEDNREQTIIEKIEQKNRLFVSEAEDYEDKAREFIVRTGGKLIIYFDYNANEISQYDFDRLSRFADIASRISNIEIIITGYTDISGSKKYNEKLSKFRANIVKSYFVGKGVNPKNIISIGMGPKASLINSVPGRIPKYNRRVEIEMSFKEKE